MILGERKKGSRAHKGGGSREKKQKRKKDLRGGERTYEQVSRGKEKNRSKGPDKEKKAHPRNEKEDCSKRNFPNREGAKRTVVQTSRRIEPKFSQGEKKNGKVGFLSGEKTKAQSACQAWP